MACLAIPQPLPPPHFLPDHRDVWQGVADEDDPLDLNLDDFSEAEISDAELEKMLQAVEHGISRHKSKALDSKAGQRGEVDEVSNWNDQRVLNTLTPTLATLPEAPSAAIREHKPQYGLCGHHVHMKYTSLTGCVELAYSKQLYTSVSNVMARYL